MRFQRHAPFIRPLINEILEPSDPLARVLKHLDVKYVARRILEALAVIHDYDYVHTY
ncbi:hypothetical protein BDV27DRAFT_129475 [Aspergillus caelatus]|uniref:Protein kinase domain-containing protein n=1 Tax=Aspergillus caelatus TaxID=61420 RepID=A0A5N7A1P9_9EURO|nr:uncharacterized protein BDV27DRAFT_129475 [Aspergillus caelatus]KAE8363787.1 hypothetical protein BDV27DRAFT_129475 [Aspergillus caelatus]